MDPVTIGVIGLAFLLLLLFIGVPIAFAMAFVGIAGITSVTGLQQAASQLSLTFWDRGTDFILVCIPLFILMGQLTSTTGIGEDLYNCMEKWFGRRRGGLAISSVFACGGFGAITGSSVACVATMGTIVYPQMRKYGYDAKLSTGVLAASGTLGILIPPSVAFAFIGTLTDTSIAALFIAGIMPALITIALFCGVIWVTCYIWPSLGPTGPRYTLEERLSSTTAIIPVALIFLLVVGTLYGGIVTPTEASGIGVIGVMLVALGMKRLTWSNLREALSETAITSAFIYAIIVGGYVLARFLAITHITDSLISIVNSLGLGQYSFIFFMVILYLILGMMLDVFGMIILTLPFIFPIAMSLQIDPVWLGVFVVIMAELALITPPVGVNVFVMRSVAPDVPTGTIFLGVVPFVICEFILVALIAIWPGIVLWLPSTMS